MKILKIYRQQIQQDNTRCTSLHASNLHCFFSVLPKADGWRGMKGQDYFPAVVLPPRVRQEGQRTSSPSQPPGLCQARRWGRGLPCIPAPVCSGHCIRHLCRGSPPQLTWKRARRGVESCPCHSRATRHC